jgi:hypothetical protein
MKISLELNATQFKKGDRTFFGQNARNYPIDMDPKTKQPREHQPGVDEDIFVMVPHGGEHLKLSEGDWWVEYPDGTVEVWSDAKVQAKGVPEPVEKVSDEQIKKDYMGKVVSDFKEHHPEPGISAPDPHVDEPNPNKIKK